MKKLISIIVLFVAANVLHAAPSAEEQATIIIEKSGISMFLQSFPEQIEGQYIQRKPIAEHPDAERMATDMIIESYNYEESINLFKGYIVNNSSQKDLDEIVLWLNTPLAKKMTDAELSMATPDGQADLLRYAANLQTDPPSQERIDLMLRFESAARMTETTVAFIEIISKGFMSSLNGVIEKEKKITEEDMEKQFENMRPVVKQLMWQQNLLSAHYMYRDISKNDIEQYIKFYQSPVGKKYSDLVIGGLGSVFIGVFDKMAPKLKALGEERNKT